MGGLKLENQILGTIGTVVLLISALLTGGYLIPIFSSGFFPGEEFDYTKVKKLDPNNFMIIPLMLLTIGVVVFGMFPNTLVGLILSINNGM